MSLGRVRTSHYSIVTGNVNNLKNDVVSMAASKQYYNLLLVVVRVGPILASGFGDTIVEALWISIVSFSISVFVGSDTVLHAGAYCMRERVIVNLCTGIGYQPLFRWNRKSFKNIFRGDIAPVSLARVSTCYVKLARISTT